MKGKFLRIMVIAIAVVMVVAMVACSAEIGYELDATGYVGGTLNGNGASGNASSGGNGSSSGSSGGNSGGSSVVVDDGPGDGSTYNLRVWCAEEDVDMIWEMLYAYADKYSANKYNWTLEKVGEDKVTEKTTDVDTMADVFSFANDQIGNFVNQDLLTEIPEMYQEQIKSQIQVAEQACMSGGKYYAIPYSYENCFLYYNKSKLDADDVRSLDNLLSLPISGVVSNLGIDMDDAYYTTMFLYTAGVELYGPNGNDITKVNLTGPEAIKACKYIASLNGKSKLKSIGKNDQVNALKKGQVAAMISGPHMISQFKAALGSNFAVAMLPTIRFEGDTEETQLISFSGVKMYGVSRKTNRSDKVTKEALKLAAYLANAQNQQKRLDEREFCPTDGDLFETAVDSGINTVTVVVNQSEASNLKPGLKEMMGYWEPMAAFLSGVYKQTKQESEWAAELSSIENILKGN